MSKITLENFQDHIYRPDLKYGVEFWKSGGVIYTIKESEDAYSALVQGSGSNYHVDIDFDGDEIIETACTCPNDWAEYCQHVIGVLLELQKNIVRKPKVKVVEMTKSKPVEKTAVKPNFKPVAEGKMLEAYRELREVPQRIVKILAANWNPLTQTRIMDTFNGCKFRVNRKNIYSKDLKPILNQLIQKRFITKNRDNQFLSHRNFSDELCQADFRSDSDFDKIVYFLKNSAQNRYYNYWNNPMKVTDAFRDMRIARYRHDLAGFDKYYTELINSSASPYTQESLCDFWLPTVFNLEKVEALPLNIRGFLLIDKLILDLFNLEKLDGYFYYAVDKLILFSDNQKRDLADLLAQFYFLRGEWAAIENISHHLSPHRLGAITGMRQFVAGENQAALATFDATQKMLRKTHRNNHLRLNDLDGIFHILARLKTQEPALLKKVDSHITGSLKEKNAYQIAFQWLKAVRLYLKNEKTAALSEMRLHHDEDDLINFFKPFCLYWIDAKKVQESSYKVLYNKVRDNGYRWMTTELLALQNALIPNDTRREKFLTQELAALKIDPLINVLPQIEDWELAIKALMSLSSVKSSTTQTESRLVWWVDFNLMRLQARVQTQGKSGWSKGRVVAYNRLKKKEIEDISAQDERIIEAIGYAYGSEISMNDYKVVQQLVGHPLLFLYKSPTVAVQLIKEKPRLIARQEDNGGFKLSFSHDITSSGFQIIKESPTRYLLMEVSEKMVQIAKSFNGKSLVVPEKGADALKEAITGLSGTIEVESAFEEKDLPSVPADSRACVHLLPVGDGFHVEIYAKPFGEQPPYLKIGQGESTIISLIEGVKTATKRDLKEEKQNLKALKIAVPILQEIKPKSGVWELEDDEHCLQFLLELSPLVEDKSIILEWPKGEKFRITKIAGMDQFRMEINEKNNWFELKGTLPIDEEKVLTMQDLLALSNQKGQFVEIGKGKFLALTKEFKDRLAQINGLVNAQKNGKIQLHPLAAPAIQNFTDALKNLKTDPKFEENKERLKAAFAQKNRVSKQFKATLRPYQKEGYQWLHRCAAWGVGACLADDMGLGKTIQALALLVDRGKLGPALVVAPASVCRNWLAETQKFAPTLNPILFGEGNREEMIKKAGKKDIIIVTYDLMTREQAAFIDKKFATIILDEAQAIKNRATKRSETAMQLEGDFKIIMTGTPVENHLGELWNLFQFANPGLLGSLDNFAKKFAIPIERDKDNDRRAQLQRLLQPFILRRKKDEVLKDLPEKTEITLTAALSTEERAFYEALRRNAVEKIAMDDSHGGQKHLKILAEIMKLRRAACHPILADKNAKFVESAKLNLFTEIVDDLLLNDHKALVFSQFVGHLKLLENHLKKQKIAYQYLDGSTPLAKRQQRIDAFQAGEGDIFLISLKAGGTGLNLTKADFVIHMDPWWNPAVEDQATDRAHRIGQERPVTVYRLIAEGTIEEQILKLHEKKRDLADSLLKGTDASAKLTAKDLLALIS